MKIQSLVFATVMLCLSAFGQYRPNSLDTNSEPNALNVVSNIANYASGTNVLTFNANQFTRTGNNVVIKSGALTTNGITLNQTNYGAFRVVSTNDGQPANLFSDYDPLIEDYLNITHSGSEVKFLLVDTTGTNQSWISLNGNGATEYLLNYPSVSLAGVYHTFSINGTEYFKIWTNGATATIFRGPLTTSGGVTGAVVSATTYVGLPNSATAALTNGSTATLNGMTDTNSSSHIIYTNANDGWSLYYIAGTGYVYTNSLTIPYAFVRILTNGNVVTGTNGVIVSTNNPVTGAASFAKGNVSLTAGGLVTVAGGLNSAGNIQAQNASILADTGTRMVGHSSSVGGWEQGDSAGNSTWYTNLTILGRLTVTNLAIGTTSAPPSVTTTVTWLVVTNRGDGKAYGIPMANYP